MNFEYNETERMLADSISRYVANNGGRDRVVASSRHDPKRWRVYGEMGWLAATLPEDAGGFGLGPVGAMIVSEAFGRGLMPEPYLSSIVLAGGLLARAESVDAGLLERVIAGEAHVAVALLEHGKAYDFYSPSTTAKYGPEDSFILDGRKICVLGANGAEAIIVSATVHGEGGQGLFLVPALAEGLSVMPYSLADGRVAANIKFDRVSASMRLDCSGDSKNMLSGVLDEVRVAAAADLLGAMEAMFEMTLDYAKTRKQFGKPIGSFQVLQHRLVDLSIKVEEARSLVMAAAMALKEKREDASALSIAAWVQALWSGRMIGEQSIQIHGAIGLTDELAIGAYMKRIVVTELLFGTPAAYLDHYASLTRCD